ncbi:hypothetical protein Vadar_002787 [Vaccinium darrowii]|uniref:Uncharacterized protein n=1 Tax=Vaccinium darrowii TaxID=229202 RepID=A0ACB7YSN1_9ERIC|nr:hypothetical protein Vadar_002787 [Vaccinium darrowii]
MTQPGKNFELGESSQGRASTSEIPANPLTTDPTEVGDNMGFFLFEVCLYQKDAELDRLLIPVELAMDHFPSLAYRQHDYEETIQITNPCNTSELATVKYDRKEFAFAIGSTWWPRIASLNKLEAKDTIRFYRPLHPERDQHYLVDCVNFISPEIVSLPEFVPENFLFQLELDQVAIIMKSLIVPIEDARKHFSALGIPAETHHVERLYFTNAENEEWRVKILASDRIHTLYTIELEEDFLDQNNLEDGDVIKFYKPVGSSKPRHFLFEVVKGGAAAGDDPAPPETEEGGGGVAAGNDLAPPEAEESGGGRRRGRKWRKFNFGGCFMALKNKGRKEQP